MATSAVTSVIRIALAQTNPTVGDLDGNARQVLDFTARAAKAGAHLVAFGEMQLTGYPVEDLIFRESFIAASRDRVESLARELAEAGLGEIIVVTGYVDGDGPARMNADSDPDRGPRDALAVIHQGRIVTRYFKHHLPNYGVFDEDRYFVSGDVLQVVRIAGVDVAFTICEDIWQAGGPFAVARGAGVGLVVNINASPYERNKDEVRLPLVQRRAAEAGATVAFVNIVGGQDELVFDGDSLIVEADGAVLARGPQFTEELLVHDVTLPVASTPAGDAGTAEMTVAHTVVSTEALPAPAEPVDAGIAEPLSDLAEVWHALVTGLRDYVQKNGFPSVVFGLSGGIDSAVVAALACDAIGPENVYAVSMPSRFSSSHSEDDAAELAKRTGLHFQREPIQSIVDAFLTQIPLTGLAQENLQARVRGGLMLMGLSNQYGHLVLAPGNKTEYATGYSTIYGDSAGGYAPIKDVLKLMVFALATWRNEEAVRRGEIPPIPENSIVKPPSAELREEQLDSDSLPPYEILDPIVEGYVDGDLGRAALVAAGHDPALVERVIKLVDRAEYKRRQTAPGPKISVKNFGRDRRLPMTNKWVEKA